MRPFMPCSLAHPTPAPCRVSQTNPAQGCRHLWELCEVCLWNRALPNCISPWSFLLSPFPEAEGKQPPSTPLGKRLSHRQPPATAQTQKKTANDWQLTRDSPELNALPQSCLGDIRDWVKPLKTPENLFWSFSKITNKTLKTLDLLIYKIALFDYWKQF